MKLDLLRAMKVFTSVVELGSFARAADKLEMSRAMVSHVVSQLESHLQTRLLHRTTRRLSLTEEGSEYFNRCVGILAQVQDAAGAVSGAAQTPRGVLRVNTAPAIMTSLELYKVVNQYLLRYPQVNLHLTLAEHRVNLIEEGIDLVLRFSEEVEPGLVARKVARIRMVTCASPRYLDEHGVPQHPKDLATHNCLTFPIGRLRSHWDFMRGTERLSVSVSGRLRAGGGTLLVRAAMAGLGIVHEPEPLVYRALQDGHLLRVLSTWESHALNLYAIYPQSSHLPAKVKQFIELLHIHVQDPPYWELPD